MMLLLLTLDAAAVPNAVPDLSFEDTVLIAPRCEVGASSTWDIEVSVEGRAHGRHVRTGESIDKPIEQAWTRTVTLECVVAEPAELMLRMAFGTEPAPFALRLRMPDWSTYGVTEVVADTDAGRKAGETWRLRGNLLDTLAWVFPPMAHDAPGDGVMWDGAWPLQLGPWGGCHGEVTAGEVRGRARAYTLNGRCEQISYNGRNGIDGAFTRVDGGFGVSTATWTVRSSWEHYHLHNDTKRIVVVTRR
jgi:hypothetical protein